MQIMGELALIFGVCLAGEAIAALIPAAFPSSVVSLVLLMVLLLTGVVKERQIRTVSHFFVANMAFFFVAPCAGIIEHVESLLACLLPFLCVAILTTPLVYAATAWSIQLMLRARRRKESHHA